MPIYSLEYIIDEISFMTQETRPTAADIKDFATRHFVTNSLVTARTQKLLDQFGFTQTQLNLLTNISRWPTEEPAPRVGELAAAVEITQPAATKLVTKFQNLGLIEFVSEVSDKRVKQVRITQTGRDLAHKMEMALYPDIADWFADWDRDHLLAFTALQKRLGVWLENNRL